MTRRPTSARRLVLLGLAWLGLPIASIAATPAFRSTVLIYDIATHQTTALFQDNAVWEAPNWSPDGQFLLINSGDHLYRIAVAGPQAGKPVPVALPSDLHCNNDKSLSPDGQALAFSAGIGSTAQSFVYIATADGQTVRQIDGDSPAYFHGWAPDGQSVAIVARRNGHFHLERVATAGSAEQPMTALDADDDGPDYSRDGRFLYFNSNRGGHWHLWRIGTAGSWPGDARAEQLTRDDGEDWFPHPSPDGQSLLFLTFPDGVASHNDRMDGMRLRLLSLSHPEQPAQILLTFPGGQGSLNVNSWAPDSRHFAFVRYDPLP